MRALLSILCASVAASVGGEEPAAHQELWFTLEAAVEDAAVDARVRAGGRLLMRRERRADGSLLLSLVRPLEHPWKLYWVDPLGPVGEEVKMATEVTLPEGSREALEQAREEVDRLAARRHRDWAAATGLQRPLDGAFAFVVIGPPAGRFTAAFDPGGRLLAVENRMTHRWLPRGFDGLAKAWAAAARSGGSPPEGYWFWNRGEAEPPPWEPHCYHALAAALELLALPAFPGEAPGEESKRPAAGATRVLAAAELAGPARRTLETLVPRTRRRLDAAGSVRVPFTAVESTPEGLVVVGEARGARTGSGRNAASITFHRRMVYDRRRRVESDAVRVRLEARGGSLELAAGHRPRPPGPPGG